MTDQLNSSDVNWTTLYVDDQIIDQAADESNAFYY